MMDPDEWEDSMSGSGATTHHHHPQHHHHHRHHHEHDSDDENGDTPHRGTRRRGSDDDLDSSNSSLGTAQYGHVTHASRRPTAAAHCTSTASSDGDGIDISLQKTTARHRSPKPYRSHPHTSSSAANWAQKKQQQQNIARSKLARNTSSSDRTRFVVLRVKAFIIVCGVGYLLLMIWLFVKHQNNGGSQDTDPFDYPVIGRTAHNDRDRVNARRQADLQARQQALQRQQRTRPPSSMMQDSPTTANTFVLMDESPRRAYQSTTASDAPSLQELDSPASTDELCGAFAQKASVAHPNSYLSRDALNSKSRVMITGILNPIGFSLALALKEQCGVRIISGMDPMFPNTVSNRMELQKRIEILTTSIPKLVQPIALPLIGLDPKVKKKNVKSETTMLQATGEVNLLLNTNRPPTHIVHLASALPEEYLDATASKQGRLHVDSPYVTSERSPHLYPIRSSMSSMEQILTSMTTSVAADGGDTKRPHLTYASSMGIRPRPDKLYRDELHSRIKLVDELLADGYYSMRGIYSVGLRLPTLVYGPWGRPGSPAYELAEAAVRRSGRPSDNSSSLLESAGLAEVATSRGGDFEFAFVDDVVDAIIAAMQYRSETSLPAVFDISSASSVSLDTAASEMATLLSHTAQPAKAVPSTTVASASSEKTRDILQWYPKTPFHDGIMKLLAWHLDKAAPFGSPKILPKEESKSLVPPSDLETGDAFLDRHSAATCSLDEFTCHRGAQFLPCASECSTKFKCLPSVFDSVAEISREMSEDCDIIMYTHSLGYDVKDLNLKATYMDEGSRIVCNFAYVPRDSRVVSAVVKKVPKAQLAKFGITPRKDGESSKAFLERMLDGLNGRLLYKGWILFWMEDALKPLSIADQYLLKLSPASLFSPKVTHAMFVDEEFPVSPNVEDVLFLVDETRRPALKRRSKYRKEKDGKVHKYHLAAEPERRAGLLVAPLKRKKTNDPKESPATHKISVHEATKFMTFEAGGDPFEHETKSVKVQREFYERMPTFVNRNDMRSPFEPWYRYQLKHWIRSRWIIHDLRLEEGRQFRCEWYQEHVKWGNDIDQLSFAHVMAKREIERRIAHQEPDDHVKAAYEEHPELRELTDIHEWHALDGDPIRLSDMPSTEAFVKIPDHMLTKEEKEVAVESKFIESHHVDASVKNPPIIYVRIMSERFMMQARKAWAASHKKLLKRANKH